MDTCGLESPGTSTAKSSRRDSLTDKVVLPSLNQIQQNQSINSNEADIMGALSQDICGIPGTSNTNCMSVNLHVTSILTLLVYLNLTFTLTF